MLQNIKKSLTNKKNDSTAANKASRSHWSSLLRRPQNILKHKSHRSSREIVDALINQQWQREREKFETIVQYNNPYYSEHQNYASQF